MKGNVQKNAVAIRIFDVRGGETTEQRNGEDAVIFGFLETSARAARRMDNVEHYANFRTSKSADSRAPSFVPVKDKPETSEPERPRTRPHMTASAYRIETDSLNMLMNQVLEQMEKGPVNLNIIARIKAHPLYDTRPMVKELLESIIAAQPEPVQKQTSKVVEQQVIIFWIS